MFDEPVFTVTDFYRKHPGWFVFTISKYITIATVSLEKHFILIYKLLNIEHCFVLSTKYVGCDLIYRNWQMFVSIKYILIPVNRTNKMRL